LNFGKKIEMINFYKILTPTAIHLLKQVFCLGITFQSLCMEY